MNELLDEGLTAHGGAQRWQSVSAITARGRLGGLLPKRFPGNKLANFTVAVHLAEQHTAPRLPASRQTRASERTPSVVMTARRTPGRARCQPRMRSVSNA